LAPVCAAEDTLMMRDGAEAFQHIEQQIGHQKIG